MNASNPLSRLGILATTALVLIFAACRDSKITASWKGPGAAAIAPANKILVLGIVQDKDIRLRMQMEGWFVDALKAQGYNAVSAYTLYGPKMFSNKSEEAVLGQLHNSSVDEVLTVTLLDHARERDYQPGTMYGPYSPFFGYYNYWYGRMYSPGYTTINNRFFWESNLYDVNSKKLLYSAQSQTFNPSSASDMGKHTSKMVVKNMAKQGVISAK